MSGMAKHLQRDLDNLQRDLLALAASVEEAIHKAIRALQERDVDLAARGHRRRRRRSTRRKTTSRKSA